jgi:hypothetical protein
MYISDMYLLPILSDSTGMWRATHIQEIELMYVCVMSFVKQVSVSCLYVFIS